MIKHIIVGLLLLFLFVGVSSAASFYCSDGYGVKSVNWYFDGWDVFDTSNRFYFDCGENINLSVTECVTYVEIDGKYTCYYYAIYPSGYNSANLYLGDSKTNTYYRDGSYFHDTHTFYTGGTDIGGTTTFIFSNGSLDTYLVSGSIECLDWVKLYIKNSDLTYSQINYSSSDYSFPVIDGFDYRLVFSDGAYYDFTCTGNEVFNYDACIWVYGYTCGVDTIKLYKDDGGWVLDDTESQSTGYDVYEMLIVDGNDYKISFIDSTIDGDIVVHNQTFACIGNHVLIDYDRCEWIYPPYPPAPPIPIYIWTGYDYNIVVFRDEHGNFIENSHLAIYDKTDNQYLQRWTDVADGYTLLGTRFDTDHDVLLSLRTFDGVFTLDTTFPANGSAPVGEENITTTNWTIPIKYNLNVLPVDQYGVSIFDVFCGLSEYTPLNPGAFWGMDLSDQGYVAVTNCSGFAMCDIIAEKEGYADYKVEALNWTSKSALVKDYRHNIVMEEE